jgi:hypothetical protein
MALAAEEHREQQDTCCLKRWEFQLSPRAQYGWQHKRARLTDFSMSWILKQPDFKGKTTGPGHPAGCIARLSRQVLRYTGTVHMESIGQSAKVFSGM